MRLIYFVCEVWCIADVLSVSQSTVDSLLRRRANAQNVSYTPNPTGENHTISTLLINPIFNALTNVQEKPYFSKLGLPMFL